MVSRTVLVLAIVGIWVGGILGSLTNKQMYSTKSLGSVGLSEEPFHKPLFVTFLVSVGQFSVLFVHLFSRAGQGVADSDSKQSAVPDGSSAPQRSWPIDFMYVGIPGSIDVVASALGSVGLVFLSTSVCETLRGSNIVFGAVISVLALGRKLYCYHWCGVLLCSVGVFLVGLAAMLTSSEDKADQDTVSPAHIAFGIVFTLFGEVVSAARSVIEEKLLKDVHLPAAKLVGYEGIWGLILSIGLIFPLSYVIPGSDNGRLEDTVDSMVMISNSGALLGLVLLYAACNTANLPGMVVTGELSAVEFLMISASRLAGIWLVELFTYYMIDPSIGIGQPWTVYSWLQLFGFGLLMLGQFVYGGHIRLPGLYYPPDDSAELSGADPELQAEAPSALKIAKRVDTE